MLIVAVGISVPALVSVLFAAEPKQTAKLTIDADDFSSVADDLSIKIKSGTIEMSTLISEARAEVEFYKNGKRLEYPLIADSGRIVSNGVHQKFETFRFAIHIVDLDHLRFGDGRARHNRWRLKFATDGGTATSSQTNIPKTDFDVAEHFGFGDFARQGSVESVQNMIPICYCFGRASGNSTEHAPTPQELIAKNPKAEIAIVYVVWE
ncbi:MAG TPA: hypothetical protein VHX68_14410 [Planctomycetaceae bacterium]|nr:hypothetical protein [Planctomycetaceae bacterium]